MSPLFAADDESPSERAERELRQNLANAFLPDEAALPPMFEALLEQLKERDKA